MRKRPRSPIIVTAFSFLGVLLLILSACGQGTPTNQGNNGNAVKNGGTWIDEIYEEPSSLLPNGSTETFAAAFDAALYAPLFYGDPKGVIHPGLVKEMPTVANGEVSSDVKTWTFKLRSGAKWSDGQPITAADVDYSWRLWTRGKYTTNSTVGFSLITSTDISADKLSITFHLKQPFVPFIAIWTDGGFAPLPAHKYSSLPDDSLQKSSESLHPTVVSGPFTVSENVRANHYTLVKNPMYYRASEGLPHLDKIIFKIVPDQDTILRDLQAGNANSAWFLDVTKTDQFKQLNNYHIPPAASAQFFEAMYFNFHNPVLGSDLNVRKALSMAINQPDLIQHARFGQAVPLCTDHGSAYHPGYQADAQCPKYDIAAANALLDSDGWVKGADGVRTKAGKRLEFSYSTTAKNAWRAADEDILQNSFKQIGVKINIVNYPADTFFGTVLPQGKYDLAEFENNWNLGYDPDDSSGFSCSQIPTSANNFAGANDTFYCNHALDALYAQEQGTTDTAVRQDAFNKIHAIYLTDLPFVTLYGPTDLSVAKNNTHNYMPSSTETVNVWEWWCDNGTC